VRAVLIGNRNPDAGNCVVANCCDHFRTTIQCVGLRPTVGLLCGAAGAADFLHVGKEAATGSDSGYQGWAVVALVAADRGSSRPLAGPKVPRS